MHWVYNGFWMVPIGLLTTMILLEMVFGSACFGHGFCFNFSSFIDALLSMGVIGIPLSAFLLHTYCFRVFYWRQREKIKNAYVIYIISITLNILPAVLMFPISLFILLNIIMLAYLAKTAAKMTELHRELALVKSQLAGDAHSSVAF